MNSDIPEIVITSRQNPAVKAVCSLRNRPERERSRLTVLEGYRELTRAFEYGIKIVECFYCPEMFLGENEYPFLRTLSDAGVRVIKVAASVLEKMAYRERPEGLVATAVMKSHTLENIPVKKNGFYLIAESIEKPGNLGSMLRSADAAGVDGLIICDKGTDLYNPNVIRASTGALFCVPLAETDSVTALNWLRANDIKILSATPHSEFNYSEFDFTGGVAIVVGREQTGLTEFWLEQADLKVKIPMLGKIDSLNVSSAATILLYEVARQRHWQKPEWSK
ncbi:MAG: RNA methyltransferase [Victivallaceae bacterium]|nr:RNA methyltransferase [Victivallaceae bacterium]